MAYHIAVRRGYDVDRLNNALMKSITVDDRAMMVAADPPAAWDHFPPAYLMNGGREVCSCSTAQCVMMANTLT